MTFNINQTEFPSAIHQAIWNAGRLIFPLNKSLPLIQDENVKEACIDLHNCVLDVYAEMYSNSEQYGLDTKEAESLLSGKSWSRAVLTARVKKDKTKQKALERIRSRIDLFHFLYIRLIYENDILITDENAIMPKENYKRNIKTYKANCGFDETQVLEIIKRFGFEFDFRSDNFILVNKKHPNLFKAVLMLRNIIKVQKNKSKNSIAVACNYLDFRVLSEQKYDCTFEDALYSLDDENKKELFRLQKFILSLKLKQICRLNSVEWFHKGKMLAKYYGARHYLDVNQFGDANDLFTISYSKWLYNCQNHFEQKVKERHNADQIEMFCLKNIKRCRVCGHSGCINSNSPGVPISLFGKTVHTCCGNANFGVESITEENYNILQELIQIKYDCED